MDRSENSLSTSPRLFGSFDEPSESEAFSMSRTRSSFALPSDPLVRMQVGTHCISFSIFKPDAIVLTLQRYRRSA